MFKFLRKNQKKLENAHKSDSYSYDNGFMICHNCSETIPFSDLIPLSLSKCPKCNKDIFIPKKMDKYWLLEQLGDGGMGYVFKAIDTGTGKRCAIKILHDKKTEKEQFGNPLRQEAQIGLEISTHANICTIIEYGQLENEYYMVTEFLDGCRLDKLVASGGVIDEEKALLWVLQILSALQHVYNCGYLYRDLKPQNLIVRPDGEDIVLFDFGLCLELEKIERNDGDSVEGSPQYFPPERCDFEKEGMYSEIYSLGMVLYYCLAGKPYYCADTVEELLQQHVRRLRMKSVFEKLENCNPDIVALIDKMIKREPTERFQTYNEVYIELDQIYKLYLSC